MSRLAIIMPACIVAIAAAGCGESFTAPTPASGTGAGGAGGAITGGGGADPVGGGGAAPKCATASECPGVDTTCGWRTCDDHECGLEYADFNTPCGEAAEDRCDGAGNCLKADGTVCASETECLSGLCVDDVCCADACDGPCMTCALAGAEGTCSPEPAGTQDPACTDSCDGAGACAVGEHLWSAGFGGSEDQGGFAVDANSQGRVVVGGYNSGSFSLGGATLSAIDGLDAFFAVFDDQGVHQHSLGFGSTHNEWVQDVAIDDAGNVYLVGTYRGEVTLGGSTFLPAPVGKDDVFVIKFDATATKQWTRTFGSGEDDRGTSIAVDQDGSVLVAGSYRSGMTIGSTQLPSAANTTRAFVTKLEKTAGEVQWARGFGDDVTNQWAFGVDADGAGNVLLTGNFEGSITFDGQPIQGAGATDVFVAKLDPGGAELWASATGDGGIQLNWGLAAGANGNVVVAGQFQGSIECGSNELLAVDAFDLYLLNYDTAGVCTWSRSFGGIGDQSARAVATDASGNVVVTGMYQGPVQLGGGPLPTWGKAEVFVAKFAANGTWLWAHGYGNAEDEAGVGIATDGSGRVLVTGVYESAIDFGGGPLTVVDKGDLFLAQLSP